MLLFFYYTLVVLVYVLALPILIIFSFKSRYRVSLPARFFLKDNRAFEKKGIWFHACSLGEVNSLKPIFEQLKSEYINLSVTTQTGYNSAKMMKAIHVRFLPFELFLPFWIKKQSSLIVTEAELWPMLFIVAKLKGAKTVLINARVSDNSYHSYKKIGWFYRWIFQSVDTVFAQSEVDKLRLEELGATNVQVNGNIKTYSQPKVTKEYKKPNKKVIIIASSHEDEEQMILNNLHLKEDEMLVVVPRHPERFVKVGELLKNYAIKNELSYSVIEDGLKADIVLCDKMGELVNLYALSDIVILCGSFRDGIGGHNPLEPAFFGAKIISGEFFFNQKPLFELVQNIKICSLEELNTINFEKLKPSKVLHKGDMKTLLDEIRR